MKIRKLFIVQQQNWLNKLLSINTKEQHTTTETLCGTVLLRQEKCPSYK